ncbi:MULTISPECIES: hypothetical protein [unclassified Moorena]|uniref:hypothetical protein n=1 Tax=unclassified Moorena TaxID=2683338 RepID=UPI001401B8E8|nr:MULTISPECIES: hypothetical protein [unclassified Moorena]NEO11157.1 hypothetical protein [Moorena sp. SIO3E8]NEO48759.1 hypothetical protein [Moorena sp. SIO4A3]NEP98066.1 hypothetical protein [Moorena sp. SIO3F7]
MWGDGEIGRWGDGEIGRWGDREIGRWGDGEIFIKGNYPDIISSGSHSNFLIIIR